MGDKTPQGNEERKRVVDGVLTGIGALRGGTGSNEARLSTPVRIG